MMTEVFLFGGILLAWAFGRNNFSNVFGSAVGTGILSLKFAAFLTCIFLFLGALLNGSGTSKTLVELIHFSSFSDVFLFSLFMTMIMLLLTRWGIPASVAQIFIGGLVGWNLGLKEAIAWNHIINIVLAWFYSPFISLGIAFFVFKVVRLYLKKYPIPILYRDILVRFLWILVGSFTAYSLGANNLSVLTTPFVAFISDASFLTILFSVAVGGGCIMASRPVIKMVSSTLFPLSSVEGLIVGFSSALTLLLFSFQDGLLPALPISIGAALVGGIVGVSFGKGGYGLKGKALLGIVSSWFWAPLFSGLLCFGFRTIMNTGGF